MRARVCWCLFAGLAWPASGLAAGARVLVPDPRPSQVGVSTAVQVALAPSVTVDPATLAQADGTPNVWVQRLRPDRRVGPQYRVSANVKVDGAMGTIDITPTSCLQTRTKYQVASTTAVRTATDHASFTPLKSQFTTASTAAPECAASAYPFTVSTVWQAAVGGALPTSLSFGPDGKLYAATRTGQLLQFVVDPATGAVAAPTAITPPAAGQILGLAFEPRQAPGTYRLWITTNQQAYTNADDWTGGVSVVTWSDAAGGFANALTTRVVYGLPRSVGDHETNSLAFSCPTLPCGAVGDWLFVTQAANTSAGAPEATWGWRYEHLLNAALLKVDYRLLGSGLIGLPYQVGTGWTEFSAGVGDPAPVPQVTSGDGQNDYNPFVPWSLVRLYATGLRNTFDLVFHSNGAVYLPTNGAGANGNSPSIPSSLSGGLCWGRRDWVYTGPFGVAGPLGLPAQHDFLFRVDADRAEGPAGVGDFRPGGYYGSPSPARCEFILGAGNPGSAGPNTAAAVVPQYAAGTPADSNYRGYVAQGDLGLHLSPDGVVEYTAAPAAFAANRNGPLTGALVIAEYAMDQLLLLKPVPGSRELSPVRYVLGRGTLVTPLDVALAPGASGRLYVSEIGGGMAKIVLLTPNPS